MGEETEQETKQIIVNKKKKVVLVNKAKCKYLPGGVQIIDITMTASVCVLLPLPS